MFWGDIATPVWSHMNGLQPFESTIEQTTETMPPSHETITAAVMTTNTVELQVYCSCYTTRLPMFWPILGIK